MPPNGTKISNVDISNYKIYYTILITIEFITHNQGIKRNIIPILK